MKVLKVVAIISLAVLFSLACNTAEPPKNASSSSPASPATDTANANASATTAPTTPPPAVIPPAPAATANANRAADTKKPEDVKTAVKVDAAAIYVAQKCHTCHGADGKGKVKGAPDFTDAAWQKKGSDGALVSQIKKGKDPVMPGYAGKLNDAEIKALVAYIRTLAK